MARRFDPVYRLLVNGKRILRQEVYWVLRDQEDKRLYSVEHSVLIYSSPERALAELYPPVDKADVEAMFWEEIIKETRITDCEDAVVDYESMTGEFEAYLTLAEEEELQQDDRFYSAIT